MRFIKTPVHFSVIPLRALMVNKALHPPLAKRKVPAVRWWLAGIGIILGLDFLSGPYLQVSFLLIIPVALIAWRHGFALAAGLGVAACLVRFSFNFVWDFPISPLKAVINLIIRSGTMVAVAWLVVSITIYIKQLREYIKTLELKNASLPAKASQVSLHSNFPWPTRPLTEADRTLQAPEISSVEIDRLCRPLSRVAKIKLRFLAHLWRHPELVWVLPLRFRAPGKGALSPWEVRDLCLTNYDLLVDGYPRSANSFSAMAFRLAHPGLTVRYHCHKPTHVIQAIRDNKPVCVLVRGPVDAVASAVVHFRWPIAHAIEVYINYYEALLPYRSHLVTATFEEATDALPAVFMKLNARFGTAFKLPAFDQTFKDKVFAEVRALEWGHDPIWVSLPSNARQPHLREIKRRLSGNTFTRRLQKAEMLYRLYTGEN